jgi:hypothetical protein
MRNKKQRDFVAKLYWQAHSDGRLCGKDELPDFGHANAEIEVAVKELVAIERKRVKGAKTK